MKKLCSTVDLLKLEIYKAKLDAYQIDSEIANRHQSSLMGVLPFAEVWPELWVIHDEDYENALRLISNEKQ